MVRLITCLLALALPASLLADVVRAPPKNCPRGYTAGTGHSGPYCAPPPPKCKKGEKPRVIRALAYCEPPPKTPCPAGSFWTSTSKISAYCRGGYRCTKDHPCNIKGQTCRETSLCVHKVRVFRAGHYEVVHGPCKTDADCKGFKNAWNPDEPVKCVTSKRCDPDVKRGQKPGDKKAEPDEKAEPDKKAEPDDKASPDKAKPANNANTPKSGGCAGCAATPAAAGWSLVGVLILVTLWWRRRGTP